ncbi:MAG: histidine phosphatase family protein [Blastocatellia bacterium]|nr:histidine phosphatase family protein [Blastocatellia bacterium]
MKDRIGSFGIVKRLIIKANLVMLLLSFIVGYIYFNNTVVLSEVAKSQITTVILVRHAEKAKSNDNNPNLSEIGQQRAKTLAQILKNVGINAIYATEFTRTQETAKPLSEIINIPIKIIEAKNTDKLLNEIESKHKGENILVVGHSNTLPFIIERLGNIKIQEINENEYNNLFILNISKNDKAKLLDLKYGDESK